jgi:hypothetical protein
MSRPRAPSLHVEVIGISRGLKTVCQECVHACKAEYAASFHSKMFRRTLRTCVGPKERLRTHVRVCLRGLEDEDYVRDIFGDLSAILESGEEGTWCYVEGTFVDVSICARTPSPDVLPSRQAQTDYENSPEGPHSKLCSDPAPRSPPRCPERRHPSCTQPGVWPS